MIELDPDWIDDFQEIQITEDRAVTMLALAMISAAWFFIGSAAGALLMWWLG